MKKINRQWYGLTNESPESPDTVLARYTRWRKGNTDRATSLYPEPINLVAAAAYTERPKKLAEYCTLYLDSRTKLWVQCIDVRSHTVKTSIDWLAHEQNNGAIAVWRNENAHPLRPTPIYSFVDE